MQTAEEAVGFSTSTGPVRVITAASLFDGHDAAINVMRRLIQSAGAEVIHLGHDRSAKDVVDCAIQEDAHAIALTSYQGGHMEYMTYIRQLLDDAGCSHVRIFAGGGGTITPPEIRDLHAAGISRIYSPEDGRKMGLLGMIDHLMGIASKVDLTSEQRLATLDSPISTKEMEKVSLMLTLSESADDTTFNEYLEKCRSSSSDVPVIGFTGTGGAGKSSLLDELMLRIQRDNPELKVCLLCVDPTRKRTGGALLGDRIRMNSLSNNNLFMRSLASRGSGSEISTNLDRAIDVAKAVGFDLIFCETSGIGQGSDAITSVADHSIYVMTAEFGAHTQLEKIEMLDVADWVVLNKYEKRGSEDALRAIRKQVRRNRNLFDATDEDLPVVATIASQFADPGIDVLWKKVANVVGANYSEPLGQVGVGKGVIPPERVSYLSEISSCLRQYHAHNEEIAQKLRLKQQLTETAVHARGRGADSVAEDLEKQIKEMEIQEESLLQEHRELAEQYRSGEFTYYVRGKAFSVSTTTESLSHSQIPRVALPRYNDDGDLYNWLCRENIPGTFPFSAGVFPFKRTDELPARMFAGEGEPEKTNRRFHYLSQGQPFNRLSTAFDSVTLYGRDPAKRPDIWGKVGNSGVSIASLDDAKRLYSGFDLCEANTSVSMTINGPAPIILAFFLNAAIDQQVEKYLGDLEILDSAYRGELPDGHNGFGLATIGRRGDELVDAETYARIKAETLQTVRGTVQADILKEDQAQNTCIFSTAFALKLMGDVQEYYIEQGVRNHYSVSISGYHIAEAGANPISQLAFTLANGFTYVEYYRSRGMDIDSFAPNLSFFFSNGLDAEYTVIGRVARRIWAVAMRNLYGGNERSQKLKYHIQTSGRSLHAQEIDFNDIRTTLQALLAIQDNANSLHTNAYDEAITTPTEESVRRALAIQMIVNVESGWTKTENPMQGSFIVEELTDLVEEAVLQEFEAISRRGGVLGAMETMYQRGKIQDESMYYEHLKHDGSLPIIGVNTFLNPNAQVFDESNADDFNIELARATTEEKQACLKRTEAMTPDQEALARLCEVARTDGNVFTELMETVKVASLGQITDSLFSVGGQYRRNM
ncbi:methylmalonyl-CoA mutase family protein [Deltaproteobacteria bacterium]|nr:methylmalonyl-CoA mutase family protein [Deltaproteobacteria bacterium]